MVSLSVAAVFMLPAGSCLSPPSPGEGRLGRPNILVVVTDDQRAQGTLVVMPEVRRWFGQDGTRFSNAFTTTPLCCPARASIFTGRYAHNHGVRHNYDSLRVDQTSTIQYHLKKAGYQTAIAGKFLNHWNPERDPPFFDRWAIFLKGEYYDRLFNVDGRVGRLPDYTTHIVRDEATAFLEHFEEQDDQPWFLYVATGAAHAPFLPEPRYERAPVPRRLLDPAFGESDLRDKPRFASIGDKRRGVRRRQLRTLMSADDVVGVLFETLKARAELDETLAVFVSDNGMQWGEHGFTGKRQAYSESIRIPLFVRWTGEVAADTRDERLAANVDVAPTVLEAAGVPIPHKVDGRSLLGPSRRKRLLLEHWADPDTPVPDWASLRTDAYQYVEYYAPSGALTYKEYYDLVQDPFQLTNLLGDTSEANDPDVWTLRRTLAKDRRCAGSACP